VEIFSEVLILYIGHKEVSCKMKQVKDRLKPDSAINFMLQTKPCEPPY